MWTVAPPIAATTPCTGRLEGRIDLPGQKVFDDVAAGDVIIFNEGLLHTGRPNPSGKTRKTVIVNFGRQDAWTVAGLPRAAGDPAERHTEAGLDPQLRHRDVGRATVVAERWITLDRVVFLSR